MNGKKLILRDFLLEDYDNLKNEIIDAKFLMQWAGPKYVFPLSMKQVKCQINEVDNSNEKRNYLYSVLLKDSLITIGHIQLSIIDRESKIGNIGSVLIYSKYRKLGFGKEVMNQILKIGFTEKSLNELRLAVFEFNTNAIKCYHSHGFKEYSFEKDSREICGEKWNLIRMKIDNKEYFKRRERRPSMA